MDFGAIKLQNVDVLTTWIPWKKNHRNWSSLGTQWTNAQSGARLVPTFVMLSPMYINSDRKDQITLRNEPE